MTVLKNTYFLYFNTTIQNATTAATSAPKTGICFQAFYSGTSSLAKFAGISGGKENTTDSNASGVLIFSTATSGSSPAERARITSGGYFKASNNGTYTNSTGTFHEFYQSADNHALIVRGANASQTADIFVVQAVRNTTNNSFYAIQYYNTTAAATRFRVADSGASATAGSISLGTATPATSGVGVQFPATQSASSDANTLDDYEEGTWTPTITSTGGGAATYTTQSGRYTKIGRVVTISFYVDFGVGTLAAGQVILGGFPFTAGFNFEYGIGRFNGSGSVTAPSNGIVGFQIANGNTTANIQIGIATGISAWEQSNLDASQDLIGTITYTV